MARAKYHGDTYLSLDALEEDTRATIRAEFNTASIQRMEELTKRLGEVNTRRGILRRKVRNA
jgi:hypothetical protein